MSTSYLADEAATKRAFTEDGFYRTGDVVHAVGDDYVFDGRLSTECEYSRSLIQANFELTQQKRQSPSFGAFKSRSWKWNCVF